MGWDTRLPNPSALTLKQIRLCLVWALALGLESWIASRALRLHTTKYAPLHALAKPRFYHPNPAACDLLRKHILGVLVILKSLVACLDSGFSVIASGLGRVAIHFRTRIRFRGFVDCHALPSGKARNDKKRALGKVDSRENVQKVSEQQNDSKNCGIASLVLRDFWGRSYLGGNDYPKNHAIR